MPDPRSKCAARPSYFSRTGPTRARPAAQHLVQPSPGIGPAAICRSPRQTEGYGRLVERQPGEEAEVDQFRARRTLLGQPPQGLVDGDEVLVRGIIHDGQVVQVDALPAAAAIEAALLLGAVDEDAAHRLRR